MRRDNTTYPGEAKQIARQKFAERKIEKWWKWSWEMKGKVKYKDLVKQQDKYGIKIG